MNNGHKTNIHNEVFKVKYKYTAGNQTYYQSYLGQAHGQPLKFIGYIQSNSAKQLKSYHYGETIELDYDVTTYNQLVGSDRSELNQLSNGERVMIKYYYDIDGKHYASLYNAEGNEWLGYIDVDDLTYEIDY